MLKSRNIEKNAIDRQWPTTVPHLDWKSLFPALLLVLFSSKAHSGAHSQSESGHRNTPNTLIPAAVFCRHVILPSLSLSNRNADSW